MDRRLSGMVVLLLAVCAVIVGPQILRPGTAGQASAAPLPAPPAVGTCVNLQQRGHTLVDCTEPHDGEVFTTWTADDPQRPVGRHSLACTDELADHFGAEPTRLHGWDLTIVNVSTRLIRAPRADRLGDRGWAACLIRPYDRSRYTGTVTGLTPDAVQRPGVFGACSSGPLHFQLPCTNPHTIERLGTTAGLLTKAAAVELAENGLPPALDARLRAGCHDVVRDVTGNTDPTYGSRLTVDVVRSSLVPAISPSREAVAYSVDCVVTSGEAALTDSVVGLGDAALPIA